MNLDPIRGVVDALDVPHALIGGHPLAARR
jgi:hypothetical protein